MSETSPISTKAEFLAELDRIIAKCQKNTEVIEALIAEMEVR